MCIIHCASFTSEVSCIASTKCSSPLPYGIEMRLRMLFKVIVIRGYHFELRSFHKSSTAKSRARLISTLLLIPGGGRCHPFGASSQPSGSSLSRSQLVGR